MKRKTRHQLVKIVEGKRRKLITNRCDVEMGVLPGASACSGVPHLRFLGAPAIHIAQAPFGDFPAGGLWEWQRLASTSVPLLQVTQCRTHGGFVGKADPMIK